MKEMLKGRPIELPKNNKQIPIFDRSMLPNRLGDIVYNLSRSKGKDVSGFAVAGLISIASVLGNKVALATGDRLIEPILWGLVIGDSGVGKSVCIRPFAECLNNINTELKNNHKEQMVGYLADIKVIGYEVDEKERRIKQELKDGKGKYNIEQLKSDISFLKMNEPPRPYSRECIFTGGTPQAMQEKIATDSPNGFLLQQKEMFKWLMQLNQTDHALEKRTLLSAYDGEFENSITLNRGNTQADKISISILGDIQTSNLEKYLDKCDDTEGFIARFQLLAIISKGKSKHDKGVFEETYTKDIDSLIRSLQDIPQTRNIIDNVLVKSEPIKYNYSSQADCLISAWVNEFSEEIAKYPEDSAMKRYLNKFTDTLHKLALVFHIIDNQEVDIISENTVQSVIKFIAFLYESAKYMYHEEIDMILKHSKHILEKPFKRQGNNFTFTASSIRDKWQSLAKGITPSLTAESLKLLEKHNYISETIPNKRDKYTRYKFNDYTY